MIKPTLKLAPIGVSTYGRLDHLKQTIKALSLNTLAKESELFIFSDAPRPGDEAKVEAVRSYLRSINGFKKISLIERKTNSRVKNNRGGMRQLLDEYGKLIWLEEDIVTAPGFLRFMNDALDFYGEHTDVLSICGYTPPLDVSNRADVFVLPRFCAWGFGITENKFNRIKSIPTADLKKIDQNRISRFGDDIYSMVCKEANGQIAALDARAMYAQYLDGSFTVYPRESLAQNIGHDGTGIHCGNSDKFHHKTLWLKQDEFEFITNLSLDKNIVSANAQFRHKKKKFTKKLKKAIGYYYLREQLGTFTRNCLAKKAN